MIFFALNDPAVNSVRKSFSFSAVCVIEIEKRNRKNEKMRTSCFNVNARCALLLLLSRSFASSSPNSSVLVVIFIKKQKSKNKEISYKHAQKSGIKQIAIIHRIKINALSLSLYSIVEIALVAAVCLSQNARFIIRTSRQSLRFKISQ